MHFTEGFLNHNIQSRYILYLSHIFGDIPNKSTQEKEILPFASLSSRLLSSSSTLLLRHYSFPGMRTYYFFRIPIYIEGQKLSWNPPTLQHQTGLLRHPVSWVQGLLGTQLFCQETATAGLLRPQFISQLLRQSVCILDWHYICTQFNNFSYHIHCSIAWVFVYSSRCG